MRLDHVARTSSSDAPPNFHGFASPRSSRVSQCQLSLLPGPSAPQSWPSAWLRVRASFHAIAPPSRKLQVRRLNVALSTASIARHRQSAACRRPRVTWPRRDCPDGHPALPPVAPRRFPTSPSDRTCHRAPTSPRRQSARFPQAPSPAGRAEARTSCAGSGDSRIGHADAGTGSPGCREGAMRSRGRDGAALRSAGTNPRHFSSTE